MLCIHKLVNIYMQKDKVNTTRPPPTNLHIIKVLCYMYITKKNRLS